LVINLADSVLVLTGHGGILYLLLFNVVPTARDEWARRGSVTISTRLLEDANGRQRARLTVRDSGEGMSPAVRARIFEPFYTTKRGKGGTGLGLATVNDLVARDGGTIDVHSEPLQGTTLAVEWPAVAPTLKTVNQSGIRAGAARGGTVLVVEDDPMVRRSARRILANAGYRVLEAEDGEEALKSLRATGSGLDLVMTDMVMPKLAGADLVARIRKFAPTVPILCVSGYALSDFDLPIEGPIACLAKPFDSNELLAAVAELLTRDAETAPVAEFLA
jgi:CheY-like chemotaxis protein